MKRLKAMNPERVRNEGCTQLELAAEIRRRAYRLYEERGRADGHAPEDWAQAEAEVLQQDRKSAAA
jgi:hypothetical protein